MDVELKILKHLRRDAHPTVGVIDEYCQEYTEIFKEVRNYECFKYLHLGIISTLKRKSLPEIALICKHKLSPIITSFYRQFRVVSKETKKSKIRENQATNRFRGDQATQMTLANTLKLSSISAQAYDSVFYPGGHGPLWDLSEDSDSIALIEALYASGKPVAAVCHAPGIFRYTKAPDGSPLLQNKSVTGFANTEEEAVD